jgi:hypothetical protein
VRLLETAFSAVRARSQSTTREHAVRARS